MNSFKINSIANIGHFFHENLFWAIEERLKDNTTTWVLDTHLTEWEREFTLLCAKHLNVIVEYLDLHEYRSGKPFDINRSPYFDTIMTMIQDMIAPLDNEHLGNKILYFRNETNCRRMNGYNNNLNHLFDTVVTNLSSMSFLDQVKLFKNCSHFVTIEGANLTNVIFMKKSAKVLNITPHINSLQMMFGTSCCVDKFEIFDLRTKEFQIDIQYNDEIENKIVEFLS